MTFVTNMVEFILWFPLAPLPKMWINESRQIIKRTFMSAPGNQGRVYETGKLRPNKKLV